MNNEINNPKSWWHTREVIHVDYGCDLASGVNLSENLMAASRVVVSVKEGKTIIEDLEGNDITENVILTFDDHQVLKAKDYIKMFDAKQ